MSGRLGSAALLTALVVSGLVLAARALFGPGRYLFSVHSPMNVEGVFALVFVALLVLRDSGTPGEIVGRNRTAPWAALLAIIVVAAFTQYLAFPFLADDYSHIWTARHANGQALWAHFTTPETDRFFRPVGYLSYALDATWAGLNPAAWRGVNLALHAVNTLLVFRLCLWIGSSRWAAWSGALIFGLHGSRPEAVTWVAARFDLLAVLFGLACILFVLRGAHAAFAGAWLILALLSKESAYVVPFLIAALLRYRRLPWRKVARRVAPLVVIEAVAFGYRLYLLGGIGGYRDAASGSPTILNFGVASSLKALLPRFWGVLLFPINWTNGPGKPVALALAAALAALGFCAWRGADRRKVLLGIELATLCSLPVHQFLSIGPDLEKSRVLYFASVGLAVVFAAMLESGGLESPGRPVWVAATVLIGFQALALQNNLAIWKRVGVLAQRTCRDAAATMPATVEGLPNVVDGVYFLHTGFPECMQFGPTGAAQGPGYRRYGWSSATRTLELQTVEPRTVEPR